MSMRARLRALLTAVLLVQLVASAAVLSHPPSVDRSVVASTSPGSPRSHPTTGAQAALAPSLNDPARTQRVQLVLDRWAAAVHGRDTVALAALFDPRADTGFLYREQMRAANLAQVPLADWGYTISDDPVPTVPPAVVAQVGADEVWAPPVNLHYALAGADPAPTVRPVGVVLARRGTVWRLVSDTAERDYGRETWRGPWDFGPVTARSLDRGVVLGHPDHRTDVDRLAAELGPAITAVTDFWGPDWQQRAAVFLPDTQDELESLVGVNFAGGEIAAVAIADDVDRVHNCAVGQRVVFNPATIGRLTALSRRVVLRHELTHVAARASTAPQVPLWLAEGFADYVGYRGSGVSLADGAPAVAALVSTAGPPDSLPTDLQFAARSSPSRVELAYQLSWTFAVYLARVRGEPALRAVYQAIAALPAPSAADIDAALQPVVGEGLGALTAEWGAWLQHTLH